jgi:hypothetical protein
VYLASVGHLGWRLSEGSPSCCAFRQPLPQTGAVNALSTGCPERCCCHCCCSDEVDAFLTKRGAQSEHEATLQVCTAVWVVIAACMLAQLDSPPACCTAYSTISNYTVDTQHCWQLHCSKCFVHSKWACCTCVSEHPALRLSSFCTLGPGRS